MSNIAAPTTMASESRASVLPGATSLLWPLALIGFLFVLHFTMVIWRGINGDEFWFYNQVQVVARGEWIQPLQTIHTRALTWLPSLSGNEIDHIIIARFFMLLCLSLIAAGIYFTAQMFTNRQMALLAVAAYLGSGFVLQHGTSFRVDPIVTALLTTALAIAARTSLRWPAILALGASIGLAMMVTIKLILWLPIFAGIALWRWHDFDFDKYYPVRWIAAGLVAGVTFVAIYILHSSGAEPEANASAAGTLSSASSKMFGFLHSPYLVLVAKAVAISLPLAIAALLVPSTVLRLDLPIARRVALLLLLFPVLTPIFYHNVAPYIYVFLLPPVAIIGAYGLQVLTGRYGTPFIAAFIALNAIGIWAVDERRVLPMQRSIVEAVHANFPQPVNYFDCCGMIGSFNKANNFMTLWGTELYLARGRPEYLETMRAKPVPLLLDNSADFTPLFERGDGRLFHPDDAEALRNTFIRLWGDIWVAGTDLAIGETRIWFVLVPGMYTLNGDVSVDGITYRSGDTITLQRGPVALSNRSEKPSRLLWGMNHQFPRSTPPDAYWTGF